MSTLKVANIESQSGGGVSAKISDVGGSPLNNRNKIINGNMRIAQRGTSQTAAGYGSIDRYSLSLSGATATMSQESFTIGQTDVPGAEKYLKLAVTAGNNNSGIFYKVEARDILSAIGGQVTLSYYAKGTSPGGGLGVGILWYDGSSTSPTEDTTVTLTSGWVKYTHTFDVPSISGLTLTNVGAYLEVHWMQLNSDTGTAAYEVNLAQVQLEVGDFASDFEYKSYADDLAGCQRYYWRGNLGAGPIYLGNGANIPVGNGFVLPVTMRTTPAGTVISNVASQNSGSVADPVENESADGGTYKCNMTVTAGTVMRVDLCQCDAEL